MLRFWECTKVSPLYFVGGGVNVSRVSVLGGKIVVPQLPVVLVGATACDHVDIMGWLHQNILVLLGGGGGGT